MNKLQAITKLIRSKGCVAFSKTLYHKGQPFQPYPYQQELFAHDLTDPNLKLAVVKGRQVGLSLGAAILILYSAIVNPHSEYIVISKTLQQSAVVFKYIRDLIKYNKPLAGFIDKDETRTTRLIFVNGSSIQRETASYSGDNLRGLHIHRGGLIFDECSFIPDKAIEAVLPMNHNAATLAISTPRFRAGYFYRACTDEYLGYEVIKVPSWIAPHIPRSKLDEWKRTYSKGRWLNEVAGEFSQGENAVFDVDSVEAAIDSSLPLFYPGCRFTGDKSKNYVWSLDVAKIGVNAWALMIGEYDRKENHLSVVAYHNWIGKDGKGEDINADVYNSPQEIIDQLLKYRETHPVTRFYIDSTSNEFFASEMLNRYLLPVEFVVWSQVEKERLYEHLATCLRCGRISLPDDPDLRLQILNAAYDTNKMIDQGDKNIYIASEFDDMVAALCMLAKVVSADPMYSFNDRIIAGSTRHDDLSRCKRQVPKRVVSLAASKRSLVRT